ncbi:MAG TPA: extensin family protein [Bradyrhizobium sp.]|uniref:extensin-like domain-containing protein n=1 Tax=Bradyrhizobium sp. TaxID=376 RepID=UPI002B46C37B|nr:extensin family protein [Bradyrhizobium sp.]HKO69978.1 extensin family protein [Bradyrhizobium sp.]
MTRGVRLYLVGSFVLVSMAGCGRGFFQFAEREPWRAEAEIACLKSGAVKESPELVRISPISGPGVCGAEFPLKVAALGESSGSFGFADEELRPPGNIGIQPRWPVSQPPPRSPYSNNSLAQPRYDSARDRPISNRPISAGPISNGQISNAPISLSAPGLAPEQNEIDLPSEGAFNPGPYPAAPAYPSGPASAYPVNRDTFTRLPQPQSIPRLGPSGNSVAAFGPVAVRPAATLACPIVSALDRWLADSVQPAAARWFGARVVEIKQISAYSCRGMNGNSYAHISEHAFGNALDIAGFALADGRHISVKEGWRGLPEEQGFLRDVQAAACQEFSTVLAPGSNAYHYDHIHVDLMRRASQRVICEPSAASGEEVAARAARRNPYASRDPFVTGSLGSRGTSHRRRQSGGSNEQDEFEDE